MSTWKHQGNRYAHAEDYVCTECGRHTSISNMSKQYQREGQPEPCGCEATGREHNEDDAS